MAFLHLSLGPQKATLKSFSGDGSSRLGHLLGWNPAGVWLFRTHADRPLGAHAFAGFLNGFEAACYVMSGSGGGLSSSFFKASESNVREFFGAWF